MQHGIREPETHEEHSRQPNTRDPRPLDPNHTSLLYIPIEQPRQRLLSAESLGGPDGTEDLFRQRPGLGNESGCALGVFGHPVGGNRRGGSIGMRKRQGRKRGGHSRGSHDGSSDDDDGQDRASSQGQSPRFR
jgi:hypothetical protein